MVTVHIQSTDTITAWRIRDALACHPVLAGTAAEIQIAATRDEIVLHGWVRDALLVNLAARLARRSAGRRVVHLHLEQHAGCLKRPRHTDGSAAVRVVSARPAMASR